MKLTTSQPSQSSGQFQPISNRRRERILKIWEMKEGGHKIKEIAEYFGISRRMVHHDLRVAPRLLKEAAMNQDGGEILGAEIAYWQHVVFLAMRNYQTAQNDNAKIGFLRVASEARAKLQALYEKTGLITTIPTRISLEEGNPFTDPEFRKKYMSLMKEAREKGISIWGL
jgi:hypothetical protein